MGSVPQNELDKQYVAMSDHPSELEFKLNNVVLAVNDVAEQGRI